MADQKTVLVVDDANLVRRYYRSALEAAGFRVAEAMNGLEALEKLPGMGADLLIVDINMPQMDGLTFLRALRQAPASIASIPALVTSTESQESDFASAHSAGANYYSVKPVAAPKLVQLAAMLSGMRR